MISNTNIETIVELLKSHNIPYEVTDQHEVLNGSDTKPKKLENYNEIDFLETIEDSKTDIKKVYLFKTIIKEEKEVLGVSINKTVIEAYIDIEDSFYDWFMESGFYRNYRKVVHAEDLRKVWNASRSFYESRLGRKV